jgi:hypothetical protein
VHELALRNVSDKVRKLGGAMANKRTPAKKARPQKAAKKRVSKATAKKVTKKRPGKATVKERASKAPAKSSRPTKPAKPRAKKEAAVSVPVSTPPSRTGQAVSEAPFHRVPVPVPFRKDEASLPPRGETPSGPPSYLQGLPRDHAELVSGFLQVVRGAAKDLKTLVTQAVAMSNQKNGRFDR